LPDLDDEITAERDRLKRDVPAMQVRDRRSERPFHAWFAREDNSTAREDQTKGRGADHGSPPQNTKLATIVRSGAGFQNEALLAQAAHAIAGAINAEL
jgi:hypothetical protein